MSNSIHAVHAVNAYTSTSQATTQAPKTPAPANQTAVPQDKVNISSAAQQALANNTKAPASGDVDHDGDSH
ncbi:MAG: hypothetical protein LAO19_17940 [Acidobacteriia bacterium]|nr:hypothetical protein [Terriglobia bacterium]